MQIWHCFCAIFTMFPIHFFYNKAYNWSIEFLQIVNIWKLYHILGSTHSMFYVWSFIVSFPYKFLVLKNTNPSFYEIHVENDYFPLPSKFKMMCMLPSMLLQVGFLNAKFLRIEKVADVLLGFIHLITCIIHTIQIGQNTYQCHTARTWIICPPL